ncbi:MAG: hypothetical protein CMP34_04635 [Rickettsiales bacterium]|nr:hypothetical protein [Rickettsiales bacterium]
MTTVANYRSIFTNNNIDDSKGLYEATKLVATNGGSGNNNLPFIFVNLVDIDDDSEQAVTIIQETPTIDQIDADNNGIITSAVESYIKHLGSGDFNKIPTSPETYRNTINPLINLINEGTDTAVQYILDATHAAAKVRQMFDDTFRLNSQLAEERRKYSELEQGMNIDLVFGCVTEENIGGLELNMEVNLTPMLSRYIELYGMPMPGQPVDSIKLTQIRDDMIAQGIDPYNRDSDSDSASDTSDPDIFDKEGPFSVNGYYPLYLEQSKAVDDSPISLATNIVINESSYWMPESVTQYFGDYDEWNTFRENNTFDNIIKTWNNDIEDGTETIFVAEKDEPLIITVSFDLIN